MIREALVRAQGYTDSRPTVSGDAIVREGIEGALEDRERSERRQLVLFRSRDAR